MFYYYTEKIECTGLCLTLVLIFVKRNFYNLPHKIEYLLSCIKILTMASNLKVKNRKQLHLSNRKIIKTNNSIFDH